MIKRLIRPFGNRRADDNVMAGGRLWIGLSALVVLLGVLLTVWLFFTNNGKQIREQDKEQRQFQNESIGYNTILDNMIVQNFRNEI